MPILDAAPRLFALVGPTAVGKTALSVRLAQEVGAEIVSADSRQVYRPLIIGAARPSDAQLAAVPHHFIGELELDAPFSAGRFAAAATERILQIRRLGRPALVVGGSTLYLEALLHGLSEVPPTSQATREELEERLLRDGPEVLYQELRSKDPESASSMDASKTQRVVRALEVLYDTGRPLSAYHREPTHTPFSPEVLVLERPRGALYERVNRRVEEMLDAGLLDENRALLAAGYSPSLNPLRTIGYREPMMHLRGEITHGEMVRRIKQNSRRYAKRQLTWFRRREAYRWLDLDESRDPLSDVMEWWRSMQ